MFKEIKRLIKIIRIKRKTHNVIFCKGANIDQHSVFEGRTRLAKIPGLKDIWVTDPM
jgi:hypothetical protein